MYNTDIFPVWVEFLSLWNTSFTDNFTPYLDCDLIEIDSAMPSVFTLRSLSSSNLWHSPVCISSIYLFFNWAIFSWYYCLIFLYIGNINSSSNVLFANISLKEKNVVFLSYMYFQKVNIFTTGPHNGRVAHNKLVFLLWYCKHTHKPTCLYFNLPFSQ